MSHDISSNDGVLASRESPERLGRWGELLLSSLQRNDPQQLRKLNRRGELNDMLREMDELAGVVYRRVLKDLLAGEAAPGNAADRQAQVARLTRQAEELVSESLVAPNPRLAAQQADGHAEGDDALASREAVSGTSKLGLLRRLAANLSAMRQMSLTSVADLVTRWTQR